MSEEVSHNIMSTYELASLIIAGAALLLSVLIPAFQALYRYYRKTKLEIIPFDTNPLIIFFNESGSYIEIKFSIACTRHDCIVKTITASVMHINTQTELKRKWTFLKPINVSWVNAGFQKAQFNGATYVHPLRLEKDSLEPLYVEFGTDLNMADDPLILERNSALLQIADDLKGDSISFDDLTTRQVITVLADRFSERLFWQEGLYKLALTIDYDVGRSTSTVFHFKLDKKDIQNLKANTMPIVFYTAPFAIEGITNLSCNTVAPSLQ